MKQLFGAVCAMVIGLGGLVTAPAQAQQSYRDHEGWNGGSAPVQMAVRPAVAARAVAATTTARRWKPAARRWTRSSARSWTRPATRSYRQYRQVWFGNKIVWWPVNGTAPVARTRPRARTWHYASWRSTPYARTTAARWSRNHRVYWHPGYWSTDTKPGTLTPEPVYRYNPNGSDPTMMNAPAAPSRPTPIRRVNTRAYPGYQYYYYGKPVTSQAKPPAVAGRPRPRSNAAAAPKDNIPTVYLYQRGHRQGIHLPPASAPAPEPAPAAATAPGAAPVPGAPPAGGGLIPGAPAAAPGTAPGAAPVPPAPPVPPRP